MNDIITIQNTLLINEERDTKSKCNILHWTISTHVYTYTGFGGGVLFIPRTKFLALSLTTLGIISFVINYLQPQ